MGNAQEKGSEKTLTGEQSVRVTHRSKNRRFEPQESHRRGFPHSGLIRFSYSPRLRSLLSCEGDLYATLGVGLPALSGEGNFFLKHVHHKDRFVLLNKLEQALRGEEHYNVCYRWIRPTDNRQIQLNCRASLVNRGNEQILEGFLIDLTDQFEELSRTQAGDFSATDTLYTLPFGILVLDLDLRIAFTNHEQCNSFDLGSTNEFDTTKVRVGTLLTDCFFSEQVCRELVSPLKEMLTGKRKLFEINLQTDSGHQLLQSFPIFSREMPQGILLLFHNTNQLEELNSELRILRKNEGMRKVTSSLTHHLNKNLQAILGHAVTLLREFEHPTRVRHSAGIIHELAEGSAGLANQLLTVEPGDQNPQSFDLNLTVLEILNQSGEIFNATTDIAVNFSTVPQVVGSVGEIRSLIQEIFIFAHQQIEPETSIQISTDNPTKNQARQDSAVLALQFTAKPECSLELLHPKTKPAVKMADEHSCTLKFNFGDLPLVTITLALSTQG